MIQSFTIDGDRDYLTEREREVIALVLQGYTDPQIAVRLGIATRTVESHVVNGGRVLRRHSRGNRYWLQFAWRAAFALGKEAGRAELVAELAGQRSTGLMAELGLDQTTTPLRSV